MRKPGHPQGVHRHKRYGQMALGVGVPPEPTIGPKQLAEIVSTAPKNMTIGALREHLACVDHNWREH